MGAIDFRNLNYRNLIAIIVLIYFITLAHSIGICFHLLNLYARKWLHYLTEAGIIELLPRSEWKAQPAKNKLKVLNHPAEYVIISHTADIKKLDTTEACCEAVRKLQQPSRSQELVGFLD